MLNLDATDIAFRTSKIGAGAGVSVGPSLLRTALPVHTRLDQADPRLVNMKVLAAAEAASLTKPQALGRR